MREARLTFGSVKATRGEMQDWLKWKAAVAARQDKVNVVAAVVAAVFAVLGVIVSLVLALVQR